MTCQIGDKRPTVLQSSFLLVFLSFFNPQQLYCLVHHVPATFHNEGIFASVKYTWIFSFLSLNCLISSLSNNVGILRLMNYHLASSYHSFMFRRSHCDREPTKHAIPLIFQKMFISVTCVYVYLCVCVLYTCMYV